MEMNQKEYEGRVRNEIGNFILWFWSDDKERERPLKALEEYDKGNNYNEL